MKKNIVLILMLLVIPLCSYSQKSVSTIEKEATNWAIQFEKMNPYQQREASNKLVKFLNSVDSQTKGIWLATLKKNDEKEQAKKLEAKKEADRKAAELLEISRQKERAKILYERSEYAKISKTISQEFDEWLIKDEFEKTTDYTIRLQNTQEVFDSIAYEKILVELGKHVGTERMVTPMLGYETEIKPTYSSVKGPRNTNLEFKNYDADRELYVLKIKIKEFEFEHEFKIPIEDAKRLMKEITYYDDSNSGYSGFVNKWREFTIVYPNELDQWIMYEHNFYPTKFTLKFNDDAKTNHEIKIPLQNTTKISISSKNMQLDKFHGNPLNFELENYLKRLNNKDTELENSDGSIILDLKLIDSFDVDGMIILNFINDKGEEFQFNSIEESLVNTYFKTNEYDVLEIDPEFLNKKFKVSYISKKVINEEYEANGEDGEYIEDHILNMVLITE